MAMVKIKNRVMLKMGKCVYCGQEKEFSAKHYLPECLTMRASRKTARIFGSRVLRAP